MKRLFLGIIAVGLAVGASAFTNSLVPAGTYYGQASGTSYTIRATSTYNSLDCVNSSGLNCVYRVTSQGADVVTEPSYTPSEIADFLADGDLAIVSGSTQGIYTAP